MLISHKYKLIFLRTEKTASTSLSAAMRDALGEDAIIARTYRDKTRRFRKLGEGSLKRAWPERFGLHPHATAAQVRRVYGPEIFDSYFKFAVERNPWERQVSLYFQRQRRRKPDDLDFDRDMRSWMFRTFRHVRLDNWSKYAIGDRIVADKVVMYHELEAGLQEVWDRVGISVPIRMQLLNSGFRDRDTDYRDHYSDASRRIVSDWYRREIDAFGFTFDPALPALSQTRDSLYERADEPEPA
ncbi:sulfotransferase family 2 domain-containing protein [Oceanomicrobium pacificus]|uniref:Sulfotransferase family 2 domain-containing protein n=1 Tax=Oceanomicrobium pacificus TaxID=2692916 RepID=A0A6B0TW14_9RHOB|nr:sulfotransferase family 2 domain-containing protein [Oceanomicrobium pacificus]MXU65354.1 sulfotransferase family 2 domain-containing protein [Oceanomicrobium pacificus]